MVVWNCGRVVGVASNRSSGMPDDIRFQVGSSYLRRFDFSPFVSATIRCYCWRDRTEQAARLEERRAESDSRRRRRRRWWIAYRKSAMGVIGTGAGIAQVVVRSLMRITRF